MTRRTVLLAALIGLLVPVLPVARSQQASRLTELVSAIAAGDGSDGRRAAIEGSLKAAGLAFEQTEFVDRRMRKGTNIVTTIQGAGANPKKLLIGAHYDRVAQGNGVVDNGASCAVLLQTLAGIKARPLEHYTVNAVFFDLEEGGLSGSRAFFDGLRENGQPLPAYAVNMDIFGYGDTFFVAAPNPSGPLANAFQQAGSQGGVAVQLIPPQRYPSSDHNIMIAAGIETLGIALIDGKEIESIVNPSPLAAAPRILTLIHTSSDTMEAFRAADAERGAAVLERFLRILDAQ